MNNKAMQMTFLQPRFQRTFIAWVLNNRTRFLVKIHIYRRTNKEILLAFAGLNPTVIYAAIRPEGIMVVVEQAGEFHDALFDLDIEVKRTSEGYICQRCDVEDQVIFQLVRIYGEIICSIHFLSGQMKNLPLQGVFALPETVAVLGPSL